jgi:quercetin dioxygenase-like cupin family protein
MTDDQRHEVNEGCTLFYPAHMVHEFHNETTEMVEFFIVVDDTRTH